MSTFNGEDAPLDVLCMPIIFVIFMLSFNGIHDVYVNKVFWFTTLSKGVFILDDDRWIEDLTDVEFAFNVWQVNVLCMYTLVAVIMKVKLIVH